MREGIFMEVGPPEIEFNLEDFKSELGTRRVLDKNITIKKQCGGYLFESLY